jgi:Family of unknown function (DUF6221)
MAAPAVATGIHPARAAAEWLRGQIQADKAAAEAAPGSKWQSFTTADIASASVYDEQWLLLTPARYDHDNPMSSDPDVTGPAYIHRRRDQLAAHVAIHDPQDVIADCDAKLALLDEHHILHDSDCDDRFEDYSIYTGEHDHGCVTCHYWTQGAVRGHGICRTVRHLAAGYQHRPGYKEHW